MDYAIDVQFLVRDIGKPEYMVTRHAGGNQNGF